MKSDQDTRPIWVSVKEARRLAGLGTTTLYALMGNGKLRSIRLGGKRLIFFKSLEHLGETAQPHP